jgi:hypothetical protein
MIDLNTECMLFIDFDRFCNGLLFLCSVLDEEGHCHVEQQATVYMVDHIQLMTFHKWTL